MTILERDAERESALVLLLDAVVDSEIDEWWARHGGGEAAPAETDPCWAGALRLFATALSREWDVARTLAVEAPVPEADDPIARWLRSGAWAWASSGDPSPGASDSLTALLDDVPDPAHGPLARFAAYLGVEGALAHARLDLAQQLAERWGDALWEPLVLAGREHPFTPVMGACRARLLAFRGEVGAADVVYRGLADSAHPTVQAVCSATGSLVRGNEAEPGEVRRLAEVVGSLAGEPRDHLTAGAHLLLAFGLVAVGDVAAAARSVLAVGLDADLGGCNVIDRALGLELLVALAVAEEDLDAAQAWLHRAAPLLASPIADSTIARAHARVRLLEGHPDEAVVWAERAVVRAEANARGIEAAEARILLNRARLAKRGPGDRQQAVAGLREMVGRAEALGHRSTRRAAARELRPLGLRLRPLSGSGWAGLSAREAEVAGWVVEGATNRQVASRLHVSEHTVRAHVSRVLAAFGVATRSGLPAAMGERDRAGAQPLTAASCPTYPTLTGRQEEVAGLVADGRSNREIGELLGLSVRTVERHVGDILQRWDLPSRTALAHRVRERRTT